MNTNELRKNWSAIKQSLKDRYRELTDDDLNELFRRLQARTRKPNHDLSLAKNISREHGNSNA